MLENALDQWKEGERRVGADSHYDRAVRAVVEEVRKRLGSTFEVTELAELYGSGTDWADEVAQRHSSGTGIAWIVDAAFALYARQASDYAGGRRRFGEAD